MCPQLGISPADAFAFSLGLVQTTVITASGVEGSVPWKKAWVTSLTQAGGIVWESLKPRLLLEVWKLALYNST